MDFNVIYLWKSIATGLQHMNPNRRIDFKDLRARTTGEFPAVLTHYGLSPVGSGDQQRIRCPFHDDEHPSCSVNLAQGLWNCHAGCGSGNLLDFVHRVETKDGATVSIREAGHKLAAVCGIEAPIKGGPGNGPGARQEGPRVATAKGTVPTPRLVGRTRFLRLLAALARPLRRPTGRSASRSRSISTPACRT